MAGDSGTLFTGMRFSNLQEQEKEHTQDIVKDTQSQAHHLHSQKSDVNLSPDSGFNSDVSSRNGEITHRQTDNVTSNYGIVSDRERKTAYRTFSAPESKHDSARDTSENGGENHVDNNERSTEKNSELKFSFKRLTRGQKVILASTSFTNLLSFLSLSILAPFFPKEANDKNVNETISGWIFGVFALVQFLSSPIFGKLLPYLGSKFMYVSGIFICGGCTLLFGFLDLIDTSDGIWTFVSLCFAVRILLALGCTSLNNAAFVMLVKEFPNDIATVFGIGEVFTGIGMVTGPAIGGFLYAAGGFLTPFAVIGGLCSVALPLIWWSVPAQDDSISKESDLPITGLVLHPKSLVNSLAVVVSAAIWAILDPTLEPHLRVYGLSSELVGILFLVMAACYSVGSPIWGWLADRIADNRLLLIPGFLLAAGGLLLLGPSPVLGFDLSFNEIWLTIVSLVILGVASSLCVIPTYDIYLDVLEEIEYPEDTRTYGMISGLWVAMYALGDFAGPSLGGFLFQEVGFEWMATYTAGACIFTSIVVTFSWLIEKKCRCCRKKRKKDNNLEDTERTPLLNDSTETTIDSFGPYSPEPTKSM